MSNRNTYLFLFCCSLLPLIALSQNSDEQRAVREGNKLYENKKFTEAESKYKEALGKQGDSYRGSFNLGDSYYQQGKYKEAAEQFEMLSTRKVGNDTLAKAFHNLGNAYLKQKEYEKSINAYKNALKRSDADEETRYNLAYAQKMLKQQQQQQQQKQDQQKKDQEKKDEKKDDKKEQQDKKDEKKKEEQQQQKQEISKEDAQRLLEALNNDEKKLRDKMNAQKAKGAKQQPEKDW